MTDALRGAAARHISQRFALYLIGGGLSANVDDFSGDFVYGHQRLAYGFTDNASPAPRYQHTGIDTTEKRSRSDVNYVVRLNGFTVAFAYSL